MWPNPQETANLLAFTEEILNGKLHFLCSLNSIYHKKLVKANENQSIITKKFNLIFREKKSPLTDAI